MITRWTQTILVALSYGAVLSICYAPLLFQSQTLYQGDISLYFEPVLRYLSDSIKAGHLPLWNPLVCNGAPQIAVISPGLFYPPNCFFLALPFGLALSSSLMFHQWLSGFGSYLLLGEILEDRWAAIAGGAALLLCGYMFGSSQCFTLAATFAWTPLALYFIAGLIKTQSNITTVALSTVMALQISAGRPELFLSAAVIYALYAVCLVINERRRSPACAAAAALPTFMRLLWRPALAVALAVFIAMPVLLPAVELFALSPRQGGLHLAEASRWSAGWLDWIQVILTRPFGDLVTSRWNLNPQYPGLFPYISSLFLGAPVVTLSLLGFASAPFRQRRFWLSVALLFFILASGEFTPVWSWLHRLCPQLMVFRYPVKLAIFTLMAMVVAFAFGWQSVLKKQISARSLQCLSWLWAILAALSFLISLNTGGSAALCAHHIWSHVRPTPELTMTMAQACAQLSLVSLLALVTLGSVSLYHSGRLTRSAFIPLLLILTLAPLAVNGPLYLWHTTERSFYQTRSPIASWLISEQQHTADHSRILIFLPGQIISPPNWWRAGDLQKHSILMTSWERDLLEGNIPMNYRLPSSWGLMDTDTRALRLLYQGVSSRCRQFDSPRRLGNATDAPLHRYCQLTNTGYLVTLSFRLNPELRTIEPTPLLDKRFFQLAHELPSRGIRIYRVLNRLPRVYFRPRWRLTTVQQALRDCVWADQSSLSPEQSVFIEDVGNSDIPAESNSSSASANPKLLSDSGEEIYIEVTNPESGFLVLSDTQYPGWQADDGGRPVEIYTANGFEKAIWLRPGHHLVHFSYGAPSLLWGLAWSSAGLIASFFLALSGLMELRKAARQPAG